eukprot:747533-Rhodomonas_salina.1
MALCSFIDLYQNSPKCGNSSNRREVELKVSLRTSSRRHRKMQSRNFAMATAAAGVLCLCIALVQVTDMAGTRRAAALQIGSQFQRGDAANSHIVPLPNAGEIGTNKAFMGKADGSG